MNPTLVDPAPRRQARAVRNDERILDAALDLTDRLGWKALTVARVAEVSGVSRPAVQARFADRSAIAVGLWSRLVERPLRDALGRVVDACSPNLSLTAQSLWEALEPFIRPTPELRTAAELLIVGRYEPGLNSAIAASLVPDIDEWLDRGGATDTGVRAARRAYGLILALGLLIEVRRHPAVEVDFSIELATMATAFGTPTAPVPLPDTIAHHLDRVANFDTGDPDLNDLLRATLEHVGSSGYEAATIGNIAASTSRTSGFLFSRYASKRELFLDANRRYTDVASSLNEAFLGAVAETSSGGVAEAVATRELMRPERRTVMTVSLEIYRLSWHDPEVLLAVDTGYDEVIRQHSAQVPDLSPAQHRAWLLMELARGNGPLVLAGLSETAWSLPYDTITVPLIDTVTEG